MIFQTGNYKIIIRHIFLLMNLIICFSVFSSAQKITPMYDPMPVPPANKSRLFYLQRTMDKNTVIYETNVGNDGVININDPVKIYWIDYDEGGGTSELTVTQNKLAYGLKTKLIDKKKKIWKINLVSYKKLNLIMRKGPDNLYHMYTRINGKEAMLTKFLVYITGGTYLSPDIKHIEITGQDKSGKVVSQKLIP